MGIVKSDSDTECWMLASPCEVQAQTLGKQKVRRQGLIQTQAAGSMIQIGYPDQSQSMRYSLSCFENTLAPGLNERRAQLLASAGCENYVGSSYWQVDNVAHDLEFEEYEEDDVEHSVSRWFGKYLLLASEETIQLECILEMQSDYETLMTSGYAIRSENVILVPSVLETRIGCVTTMSSSHGMVSGHERQGQKKQNDSDIPILVDWAMSCLELALEILKQLVGSAGGYYATVAVSLEERIARCYLH